MATDDLIRLRLFFVSYVPLWGMIALRTWPKQWHFNTRSVATVIFLSLAIGFFIDAFRLINGATRTDRRTLCFGDVEDQGGNAAAYLATYLLPFIGLIPEDWGDWAAYAVYFVVAAIVFIRTDLTFVNPTLYLMGRRVVSAIPYLPDGDQRGAALSGTPSIVVCRNPKDLSTGRIDVVSLGGGYIAMKT